MNESAFCSTLSAQAGEALYGTAPQAEAFLLLEYNGRWGQKAFEQSELPPPVKEMLSAFTKAHKEAKLLLIKNRAGLLEPGLRFYCAHLAGPAPRLYAFHLQAYDEMLGLNLEALLNGDEYAGFLTPEPLFLVCVNGRRDPCCARLGEAVYRQALQAGEAQVWQSTHMGGHRFAPVLACLPHGIVYGRAEPPVALQLIRAFGQGQVDPDYLRGRASYAPAAQAAEVFLMKATGRCRLQDFRHRETQALPEDRFRVKFEAASDRQVYELTLRREATGRRTFQSCDHEKESEVMNFRLEAGPHASLE